MTELKTLKDLKKIIELDKGKSMKYNWLFRESDLKAEAIKWVKAHGSEETGYASLCNLEGWMQFFNLTEEDLK